MIFQAVVSNKAHPEYGAATIPFPIPDSEYDQTIELLEGLAIGSPTSRDCQVDGISGSYPILNRLMSQSINVDDLDYLAKRMESFCTDEDARFQAMAFKFCLSNMAQPTEAGEIRQLAENLDQFDFLPGVELPERNSQLNELGYVAYHGSITLDELMRDDPAERYQQEMEELSQGQTMC